MSRHHRQRAAVPPPPPAVELPSPMPVDDFVLPSGEPSAAPRRTMLPAAELARMAQVSVAAIKACALEQRLPFSFSGKRDLEVDVADVPLWLAVLARKG